MSGIANDSAGPEGSCQNRSRDQRQVTNLASTWPWCPTKKQQVRIEEGEREREIVSTTLECWLFRRLLLSLLS